MLSTASAMVLTILFNCLALFDSILALASADAPGFALQYVMIAIISGACAFVLSRQLLVQSVRPR